MNRRVNERLLLFFIFHFFRYGAHDVSLADKGSVTNNSCFTIYFINELRDDSWKLIYDRVFQWLINVSQI